MPKNFYPVFILCLLGSFLLFSAWSAFQAVTPGTRVTDRDYYSKGLRYNSTMVEKRAAEVLGWKIAATLFEKQLQISLLDGDDSPVTGASGQLSLYTQKKNDPSRLSLTETTPGIYRILFPEMLNGEITVQIEFEYDGARINRQLLLNI